MAWNSTTKILTYPFVKIAANGQGDLQLALRRSALSHHMLIRDVDANGNYIGAINIWAKYKPFSDPSLLAVTPTAAGWTERNTHAAAKMYGFLDPNTASLPSSNIFDPSNANAFQKFYENTVLDPSGEPLNGWRYFRPLSTYARALDFHGYRANAGHPVAIKPTDAGSVSRQYSSTFFMFSIAQLVHDSVAIFTGDDGQLSLYDFADLRGKRFGVLLQSVDDPSKRIFKTSDVTLAQDTASMSVSFYPYNFPAGYTGDFMAYFFFTSTQIPQGTSSEGATAYPIPGCEICMVNIVDTMYGATIKAYKTANNGIRAEYSITNLSNTSHTFSTNELRCRFSSVTSWNDPESAEEAAQNKELGSITVGAGETVRGVVVFSSVAASLYASCRIWGKFGSTEVAPFSVAPIAPLPPED